MKSGGSRQSCDVLICCQRSNMKKGILRYPGNPGRYRVQGEMLPEFYYDVILVVSIYPRERSSISEQSINIIGR